MGSERAPIEEEEQLFPPMQLQGPSNVAVDDRGGEGSEVDGEGESDVQGQLERLVRGRGPSLLDDIEQLINRAGEGLEGSSSSDADDESAGPSIEEEEKEPDPGGAGQRSAPPRSLIEEEDEEKAPAIASPLMDDIDGARELQKRVGANPYRGLIEAGEVLQGGANSARRLGEGRYGAAVMHSLGGLAVKAASGEAGAAAGNASKEALTPLTAATVPVNLAKDAAKYTVGNLISTTGQAVQKIGEGRRDAVDPEGILEKQRLIDLKNRHEFGYDKQNEDEAHADPSIARARQQAVEERGVRFEKGDHAKKIWGDSKNRSWGRIAQNALMAPVRGIGKAVKALFTSPADALKGIYNPVAQYGRKAGNWLSNNRWNRKRRARNALARLRRRAAEPGGRLPEAPEAVPESELVGDQSVISDQEMGASGVGSEEAASEGDDLLAQMQNVSAAPAAANRARQAGEVKAMSQQKPRRFLNWRGRDAAIRKLVREHRREQGFDNVLGQKDYETLSKEERREYVELDTANVKGTQKYKDVEQRHNRDLVMGVADQFDQSEQGEEQKGEVGEGPFELVDSPLRNIMDLPKDKNPGTSTVDGITKVATYANKLGVEIPKKAAPAVTGITHVLGQTVPDMLKDQPIENYMPTAEGAKKFGENYKAYNANAALYRAPLMAEGVGTAAELFNIGKQYRNRKKDPTDGALNERRAFQDTRRLMARQEALLKAKQENGEDQESIAQTQRNLRRSRFGLLSRNLKLAAANVKNGITPLNEYSKKESDFIKTGTFAEKPKEAGAKGLGELGKEIAKGVKGVFGAYYGGTNTADDNTERERLYPSNMGGDQGILDPNAPVDLSDEDLDEARRWRDQMAANGQEGEEKAPSSVASESRPRPSDFHVWDDDEPADEQAPADIAEEFAAVDDGAREQRETIMRRLSIPRRSTIMERRPMDGNDNREEEKAAGEVPGVPAPRQEMVNAEVDEPAQQANIDPAPSQPSAAQKMAARGLSPLIAEEATSMNAGSYVSGSADNLRVMLERLGIGKAGR